MAADAMDAMTFYLLGDGSTYTRMLNQAANASTTVARQIQANGMAIQRMGTNIEGYAGQAMGWLDKLAHKASSIATMGLGSIGAGPMAGLLGLTGVGGAVAGASWAISQAAEIEKLAISFEVMLGSASAASKMLTDIQKFAAETPFEMMGLKQNVQMMLNFGVAQKDVMKYLKMLGDVSGGDQNRLSGLTYAFSQVQAAGKLMGQDLMQMINHGFNPLQEMARTTGKSLNTLRMEMSAGKITSKMVADAFLSASSEGGKFNGMMQKQSQTFSGLMSTIKDTIVIEAGHIGTMLIEKLKLKEALNAGIAWAAVWAPKFAHSVGMVLDYIVPKIQKVGGYLMSFVTSYIVPMVSAMIPILQSAWNWIGVLFGGIQNGIAMAIPYLKMGIDAVVGFVKAAYAWVTGNKELMQTLGLVAIGALGIWAAVTLGPPIVAAVVATISGLLAFILNPITLIVAGIGLATYAFLKWTDAGKAVSASLTEAFGWITTQFELLVELIKVGEFEAAWKVTVANLKYIWAEFTAFSEEVWIVLKYAFLRGIVEIQAAWIGFKTGAAAAFLFMVGEIEINWNRMMLLIVEGVNIAISAYNKLAPESMELKALDTAAYEKSIAEASQFYADAQIENANMGAAEIAAIRKPVNEENQAAEMLAARKPADEAKKAWEEAQVAANKAVEEGKDKQFINNMAFGDTFLGKYMGLGQLAVEGIQAMLPAATTEAANAGNQVGAAYGGAVNSAMGAIDAVKAGSSKAYDLLQAYQGKMNPQLAVTQNTKLTAEDEKKKEFTTMATGITELVEQGRTAAGSVIEFATGLFS